MNMKTPKSFLIILFAQVALFGLTPILVADDAALSAKQYLITDFGAVADGKTVNTKSIQSAIDRCTSDGGGVVVVPQGTFLSGALFFKQGVNLLVEKNSMLKGTANPDDYPQVNTRWEGVERKWTCAFLNFNDMTNVRVSVPAMSGCNVEVSAEGVVGQTNFLGRPMSRLSRRSPPLCRQTWSQMHPRQTPFRAVAVHG